MDIANATLEILSQQEVEDKAARKGDGWEVLYFTWRFPDISEWCVGATYKGFEWKGKSHPVAVFEDIELAFAFARVLNLRGLDWVKENRHRLEVNLITAEEIQ